MWSDYHAKLWATLLTLRGGDDRLGAISRSVANARVDLNPHQIDAALFALSSPLRRGVILADEVGLGKTIEAGLVLAQRWAERRRKLLVIVPASLRKQWQQELAEKFFLPSEVLEGRAFNRLRSEGVANPFDLDDMVVLCSYQFAATRPELVRRVPWDLVVVDEAHRLRNVYRSGNKTAQALSDATRHARKLLLTATPLQNSLMELYGLVSVIDDHVFGDQASFREQFIRADNEIERDMLLRERLGPVCTRTLRKHVTEYVRYTERLPVTQEFYPSDEEQRLYDEVSAYLHRDVLAALPPGQRGLMAMVMRKLLASSSFAIGATLRRLADRLEGRLPPGDLFLDDFEGGDDGEDVDDLEATDLDLSELGTDAVRAEIAELRGYANRAESIQHNTKGEALLKALQIAFDKANALGARRKAVIFTESRRTQQYLASLLEDRGFAGRVLTLDGTNSDPRSAAIYEDWLTRHRGQPLVTGARAVDIKAALIEAFRGEHEILIATEAGAEGINLQFCSLVVNYDLPWNPQRIEQRIGRCHRYGQKHDVVVVNFLNLRNAADRRVHELLASKFHLFDGIFGASDEVLGALESGVDIEHRIAEVYQTCRTEAEIQQAFDLLQAELQEQIQARLASTRQALLDHFDEEVHARLKFHHDQAQSALDQRQRWLLNLARHELRGKASFDGQEAAFVYRGDLGPRGLYHLDWRTAEQRGGIFFRPDHPLAAAIIERAAERDLPRATLHLDLDAYGVNVAALAPLRGQSGWLHAEKLVLQALEPEEFVVFAGMTDDGEPLGADAAARLLNLPVAREPAGVDGEPPSELAGVLEQALAEKRFQVERKNMAYFDEEVAKLDRWAEDLKLGLVVEIREMDQHIREAQLAARGAASLAEKLQGQRRVRDLERKRNERRRHLFEAQDRIDAERDELIAEIERRLVSSEDRDTLILVHWTVE